MQGYFALIGGQGLAFGSDSLSPPPPHTNFFLSSKFSIHWMCLCVYSGPRCLGDRKAHCSTDQAGTSITSWQNQHVCFRLRSGLLHVIKHSCWHHVQSRPRTRRERHLLRGVPHKGLPPSLPPCLPPLFLPESLGIMRSLGSSTHPSIFSLFFSSSGECL